MKRPSNLKIFSLFSLLIGILLAYFIRGNIIIYMVVFGLVIFGFIPALVVYIIFKIISTRKHSKAIMNTISVCKIIIAVVVVQVVIVPLNFYFLDKDVESARSFCNEIAVIVEKEKEGTGIYPSDIEHILREQGDLPRFINTKLLYSGDNEGYSLKFVVTGAGLFPHYYTYDNQTKVWEQRD